MAMVPMGEKRMSWPVGFELTDRAGVRHEFLGEGFKTPFNSFILIHCVGTLPTALLVSAA